MAKNAPDSGYEDRRLLAANAVDELGRGARIRIAYDTKIHPASISRVLNGQYDNLDYLIRIEEWLVSNGS